jgi:hypothetical protein
MWWIAHLSEVALAAIVLKAAMPASMRTRCHAAVTVVSLTAPGLPE